MSLTNQPKKHPANVVMPTLLSTQIKVIKALSGSSFFTHDFGIYQRHFATLGNQKTLTELQTQLLDFDISQELQLLTQDHALEITIPMLAMTDLGHKTPSKFLHFTPVVAINGWGSKADTDQPHQLGQPEFVYVTDMIGNRYEILVNAQGEIELPADGTGLFTIIHSITFVYSANQVLNGQGFADLTNSHIKKNKLYLYVPCDNQSQFSVCVCVTHLDNAHRRIVDTIRTLSVKYQIRPQLLQQTCTISATDNASVFKLNMHCTLPSTHAPAEPFTASLTLSMPTQNHFNFYQQGDEPLSAWLQHPMMDHVFTRYYGLSKFSMAQLIRNLYSLYDLMRDYLSGDTFELTNDQGYNNFLLRPEAFEPFYNWIVHDLIYQRLAGDFLLNRLPEVRYADLDFAHFDADFHDSVVLEQLQNLPLSKKTHGLRSLFLTDDKQQSMQINDEFYVFTAEPVEQKPNVSLTISFDHDWIDDLKSNFDGERRNLHPTHEAEPLMGAGLHSIEAPLEAHRLIFPTESDPKPYLIDPKKLQNQRENTTPEDRNRLKP